jgi:hypothetical protein
VTLLIAALGTDRARAYATACPLPVEADMRHLDRAPLLTHCGSEVCIAAANRIARAYGPPGVIEPFPSVA